MKCPDFSLPNNINNNINEKNQSVFLSSTLSGLLAGILGVTVGYPFDTMKTRLQNGNNEPIKKNIRGLFSLYRGVAIPFFTTGIMQSLNFAIYGSMKYQLMNNYVVTNEMSYLQSVFLSGSVSGGVMSIFATPIQLIKIQYQTNSLMTIKKLNYELLFGKKLPLIALYRGYGVTALGDIFGRGLYMYTYESMKLYLSKQDQNDMKNDEISMINKMISAAFAGSFTWFVFFPIDVIKTRVQADINGVSGRQHFVNIIRRNSPLDALRILYKGSLYAIIRAAPVAASILPVYEFLNQWFLFHL